MKRVIPTTARVSILMVCALVLYRLSPVVSNQWHGLDACPMLLFLPACYLVFAGYTAMGLAAAIHPRRLAGLFFLGWVPVFLLALTGTLSELLGWEICPHSETGVPLCFCSLCVASLVLGAYFLVRRFSPNSRPKRL